MGEGKGQDRGKKGEKKTAHFKILVNKPELYLPGETQMSFNKRIDKETGTFSPSDTTQQ